MTEPKFFRSVVGTRIRYLRTLRRMDQSVLADAIGIYPSTLNKIENGSYGLDTVDAVKISEALKVSLDELLAVPSEEPEHAA
jgi:transcriptional regulator with XRE-family HTH domain